MSDELPTQSLWVCSVRGLEDAEVTWNLREASCVLEVLRQWSSEIPGDSTLDTLRSKFCETSEQLGVMIDCRYEMLHRVESGAFRRTTELRAWQVDMQALADEIENMALLMSEHTSFGSQANLILLTQRCCKALREVTGHFELVVQRSEQQQAPIFQAPRTDLDLPVLGDPTLGRGENLGDCPDLDSDQSSLAKEDPGMPKSDVHPGFSDRDQLPDPVLVSEAAAPVGSAKQPPRSERETLRSHQISRDRHQEGLVIAEVVQSLRAKLQLYEVEMGGRLPIEQIDACLIRLKAV